jgi:hypothetical protein
VRNNFRIYTNRSQRIVTSAHDHGRFSVLVKACGNDDRAGIIWLFSTQPPSALRTVPSVGYSIRLLGVRLFWPGGARYGCNLSRHSSCWRGQSATLVIEGPALGLWSTCRPRAHLRNFAGYRRQWVLFLATFPRIAPQRPYRFSHTVFAYNGCESGVEGVGKT